MSASAFSHALGRLRQSMADELFVRFGNEMQPTVAAERMATWVSDALGTMSNGLQRGKRFDPASSERTFIFAATDYTAFAVMPAFIARMEQQAPGLRFRIVSSPRKVSTEDLAAGRIDFAVGYSEESGSMPSGIEDFDWLTDDYVVIASQRHPEIRRRLSLAQYLAARHLVVTPWNETRGAIDSVLDKLGLRRDVAVHVPSVLAAPFIIAESSLVMTVPQRAARVLSGVAPVRIFAAPFSIPSYTIKIYCHAKHARTDAHVWLREQLLATATAVSKR